MSEKGEGTPSAPRRVLGIYRRLRGRYHTPLQPNRRLRIGCRDSQGAASLPQPNSEQENAARAAIALGDPRVAAYVAQSGRSVHPVDERALETQEARALWAWWQGAASGGRKPHRTAFDIIEHRGLAPHLYLIEPVAGGYRLRLAGEVFEHLFRRSRGHVWLRDSDEGLAGVFAGYFDFVSEQAQPYRSIGRMNCEYSDWFSFESLLCPLRHEDGDQLLGVVARVTETGA